MTCLRSEGAGGRGWGAGEEGVWRKRQQGFRYESISNDYW